MSTVIVLCIASYLIGSIPSGLILGKRIWGVDLREHGSGNIGATNAWRVIGKRAGISIFLLDFFKGALAVLLGISFCGFEASDTLYDVSAVLCGIMAILGHSASVFLGFKGGKSVATGLGVLLVLMPKVTGAVFLVWLAIVMVSGYVSLGSCIAAGLVPILAVATGASWTYVIFGLLAGVFVIVRHSANIQRLRAGTESKITSGGRKLR